MMHLVEDFDPEKWLKFPNHFPEKAILWKKIGFISFPLGFSHLGMCGGVAGTALDFFYHRLPPPTRDTPPSSQEGPALFNWLKQRQVDSVTFKDFWKYLPLMFSSSKKDIQATQEAWEQIKKDILANDPVLIGLIRAKVSAWYKIQQVVRIVQHHQVVVWGFEEKKGKVKLYLYDPNTPHRKDLNISFNIHEWSGIQNSQRIGPIYAFFKTSYTPCKLLEGGEHYA